MPMNAVYAKPGDLADTIPVFPLPGALLLPRGQMPLNIFEPRYVAMIDAALRSGHRLHSRPPRTEVALVPGGGAATEFERPRSRMAREAKILLTRCSQCRALGLAILDTSWLWHCSVSKCVPHTLSISSHLG